MQVSIKGAFRVTASTGLSGSRVKVDTPDISTLDTSVVVSPRSVVPRSRTKMPVQIFVPAYWQQL